jgi:hypothetical protein
MLSQNPSLCMLSKISGGTSANSYCLELHVAGQFGMEIALGDATKLRGIQGGRDTASEPSGRLGRHDLPFFICLFVK